MLPIIIIIISLLLDGLLTNILPYLVQDLSLFTPLLTLVTLFIIYPFYRKKEKQYLITTFIIGMVYDLFYTNLLFFNSILFLIIGLMSSYINKKLEVNCIRLILYILIIIVTYESLTGLILFIYNIVPVTIPKVIYKITHSIVLNVIYTELVYLIIKIIPNRFKEISIN